MQVSQPSETQQHYQKKTNKNIMGLKCKSFNEICMHAYGHRQMPHYLQNSQLFNFNYQPITHQIRSVVSGLTNHISGMEPGGK